MNVVDLLEEADEGSWISLEVDGEVYQGEIEINREYTESQRNKISEKLEEEDWQRPNENYLDGIEPEGDVINAEISNTEEDYEIEINPFNTVTYIDIKENGETTEVSEINGYLIYSAEDEAKQKTNNHSSKPKNSNQ